MSDSTSQKRPWERPPAVVLPLPSGKPVRLSSGVEPRFAWIDGKRSNEQATNDEGLELWEFNVALAGEDWRHRPTDAPTRVVYASKSKPLFGYGDEVFLEGAVATVDIRSLTVTEVKASAKEGRA